VLSSELILLTFFVDLWLNPGKRLSRAFFSAKVSMRFRYGLLYFSLRAYTDHERIFGSGLFFLRATCSTHGYNESLGSLLSYKSLISSLRYLPNRVRLGIDLFNYILVNS
jgi:hypothetical protein